ncbi:hypothetical protein NDU88_003849 [Pleurodeles waltl]|uniref:Uncharacterized protein n=1 Tax=Pleurodeles waltl TaxID=8319 RepID=A0AAV7PDU9_PLEWA|nr:hypothetical protein NDU88_003849 [Pleurodeles waltl]
MWRLNTWYLQDEHFKEQLRQAQAKYFHLNEGSVTAEGTLWAAGKAVLRVMAKNLIHHQERAKTLHITQLELRAINLERDNVINQSKKLTRQLLLI